MKALIREVCREGKLLEPDRNWIPSDKLRLIMQETDRIGSRISVVQMVEPKFSNIERRKWLAEASRGNFTDPVFYYDEDYLEECAEKYDHIVEMMRMTHDTRVSTARDGFVKEMLMHILSDLSSSAAIARAILHADDALTKRLVAKKYGTPPIEPARIELENKDGGRFKVIEEAIGPHGIVEFFDKAQGRYGFHWPIYLDKDAVAIDVRDKSKRGKGIFVPSERTVSTTKLLRLVGHEIESHQRVSENGMILFGFGSGGLKTDNEDLYEGLALISDRDFDLATFGYYRNETAIWYVRAIQMALSGMSFGQVAENLYHGRLHEDNALIKSFNMTRRVMRGITWTENRVGYAFTKDLAYYRGLLAALELEKEGFLWLLELGNFDYWQLNLIARTFKLTPDMIPFKRIDLKNDDSFVTPC